MTIHWKAVAHYFTVVMFVNPLTPRVKPWVIQSFLTFDSMDRLLKCDHLFFNFPQSAILENLDLALSGVKRGKLGDVNQMVCHLNAFLRLQKFLNDT